LEDFTVSQDQELSDEEIIEVLYQEGYDIAQICKNGHIINTEANLQSEHNQRYCSRCGAECIARCPACNMFIKGAYLYINFSPNLGFTRPKFCANCGDAYPWTKIAVQSAKEMADELDTLTDSEKAVLKQSFDEIVKDTPQTKVAATRIVKLIAKGGEKVGSIIKDSLVDFISEAAKNIIFPS
jgi:hypothetical protein